MRLFRSITLFAVACAGFLFADAKPDTAVFVNALQHSGHIHISMVLEKFFDLRNSKISDKSFPRDEIYENGMQLLANNKDRFMNIAFVHPSQNNINLFRSYLPKVVLHVRDPREALVSHLYYVDVHKRHKLTRNLLQPNPPDEYFSWTYEQKADWQIQNFYDGMLNWLVQWVNQIENDSSIQVLVNRTEDLVQDQLTFFKQLVAFYGVDPDSFTEENLLALQPGYYHFYQSENQQTWKEKFTPEQQAAITARIPEKLIRFFGFER